MRKNRTLVFLSSLIYAVFLSVGVLAAGEVKTETIGNLEYEVPVEWTVNVENVEDIVTKTYTAGENVLTVSYIPVKMGRDSLIQDAFLDMLQDEYTSSFDYYQEFERENYEFEENRGRFRLFQYYDQTDKTDYGMAIHMMCTGKGIGMFEFRFDAPSAATGNYEEFSKIIDTVRTVALSDESEKELSESEKEYTKYPVGFYKVGTDIPEGEYIVFAENNQGYFRVSADREQNDILFKESFSYNSIITIKEGEYLELSESYAIPIEEDPEVILSGSGMFKAGLHIPEGRYKLQISGVNPYYCVYSDSRHGDIIDNSNFEDEAETFVAYGSYLLLDECKFMRIPEGPVKNYTDSETVKKVQEALNAAGYDCGTPDGILENVIQQVGVYQLVNGLTLTMTITEEVLASLGI